MRVNKLQKLLFDPYCQINHYLRSRNDGGTMGERWGNDGGTMGERWGNDGGLQHSFIFAAEKGLQAIKGKDWDSIE